MSHDNQLQQDVLAELNWEPGVTAGHVSVTAKAGTVTLTGHVESFAEKQAAVTAAHRVAGVKEVAETIEVRLPASTQRSDDAITAAAKYRLAWDVSIPEGSVAVDVENGRITLTGQVDHYYQKNAAEENVRRLFGVTGVSNRITIKPTVNVADISDEIMHALHRSWFFDPHTIKVSAEGGRVRLSGTARSPHERQVAAATAWAAPGVIDVENEIDIV